MVETVPVRYRGRARRDAAAFYLSQLARGVLSGEVTISVGELQATLATAEFVFLEVDVKQKKRTNQVAIKLTWPRRPLIRIGPEQRHHDGRS
jgi:amphi-Trp domain-containing protein